MCKAFFGVSAGFDGAHRIFFLGLVICMLVSPSIRAQRLYHRPGLLAWEADFRQTGETRFYLPVLRCSDLRALATCGSIAYLLMRSDQELDEEYALEGDDYLFRALGRVGKVGQLYDQSYSFYVLGGMAAAALGYSWISRNSQPAKVVRQIAEALAVSTITTSILKAAVGRHRPYTGDGAYAFEPLRFPLNSDRMSFPSGHTTSMFAMATVLAGNVNSPWLKSGAYSFAASVGLERMLHRKHWASDVIVGAVLGRLVGALVVRRARDDKAHLITLIPSMTGKMFGIGIRF